MEDETELSGIKKIRKSPVFDIGFTIIPNFSVS